MLLRRTPARVEREKEEARVDGVVTPDSLEKLVSKHDKTIGADGEEEFGGQFGALAIMVFSHAVVYGLYLALEGGTSPLPSIGQESVGEYAARLYLLCFFPLARAVSRHARRRPSTALDGLHGRVLRVTNSSLRRF